MVRCSRPMRGHQDRQLSQRMAEGQRPVTMAGIE